MKASVKGLLVTLLTFIASAISTSGFPQEKNGWIVLGITVVGTVLIYLGKNQVMPSVSLFGTIDLRDVISGLIMAIGTGLSNWVGTIVAGTAIDWHSLWTLIGSVVVGYFAKNFATKAPSEK